MSLEEQQGVESVQVRFTFMSLPFKLSNLLDLLRISFIFFSS